MSERAASRPGLSLRLRLLAIVAGALAVPAGLAGADAALERARTADAAAERALAAAHDAADRIAVALAPLEGAAALLARVADSAGEAAACATVLVPSPRGPAVDMLVAAPSGTVVCATLPDSVGADADPALGRRAPAGPGWREPAIALVSDPGGRRRVAIAHPLRNGGVAAVLVAPAGLAPEDSATLATALVAPDGTVLDARGRTALASGAAAGDPVLAGLLRRSPSAGATDAAAGLRWSLVPVPRVAGLHFAAAVADDPRDPAGTRDRDRFTLILLVWAATAVVAWAVAEAWILRWLRHADARPSGRVPRELARLADADARRAADLSAAQESRAAAEAAAAGANARAARAARAAEDARAAIARSVRTPMSGVLGFTDLLLASDLSAQQRRHAHHVRDSARALLGAVNDALGQCAGAEPAEIPSTAVSPAAVVEGCAALVRRRAEAKGLVLRTATAPETPGRVTGDPIRLRQALANLADNAVRATTTGSVLISAAPGIGADRRPALRFAVIDTGPGLPDDIVAGIVTAPPPVAGLGLRIAHDLVRAMGGRLGATRRAGGSEVWIEIPLADAPGEAPATPPALRAARPPRHILLAEDNAMNEELIRAVLESAGHTVASVGDGRSAVEAIRTAAFDLALLDVRMPVMSGLDATTEIRRLSGASARIPIIILTADTMPEDVARALAAGADAHHAKPIVHDELLAAIDRLTANAAPVDASASDDGLPEDLRQPALAFDPAPLDSLRARMAPERFRGLLSRAIVALPDRLRRLRADADPQVLGDVAHETAGAAGTYGLAETARLCRLLQRVCDGRLEGDRDALLRAIAASAASGMEALAAYAVDRAGG